MNLAGRRWYFAINIDIYYTTIQVEMSRSNDPSALLFCISTHNWSRTIPVDPVRQDKLTKFGFKFCITVWWQQQTRVTKRKTILSSLRNIPFFYVIICEIWTRRFRMAKIDCCLQKTFAETVQFLDFRFFFKDKTSDNFAVSVCAF